jgi:hypothetical protein
MNEFLLVAAVTVVVVAVVVVEVVVPVVGGPRGRPGFRSHPISRFLAGPHPRPRNETHMKITGNLCKHCLPK